MFSKNGSRVKHGMTGKVQMKTFFKQLKRNPESHKYDYGHILVIAGSKLMPGAGVLCLNAVMRSGGGLVTYAVREDFLVSVCAMSKPETMFFVYKTANNIIEFVKKRKVDVIVLGPGMAAGNSLYMFAKKIISSVDIPVVLDASALAAFSGKVAELKKAKAKLILTPHTGEFAKIQSEKWKVKSGINNKDIKAFAKEHGLICLLKGHNTIVSDGSNTYINKTGTPAMATAGSGDVLSGIIAAFCAVSDNLFEAVCAAVYVHGLAGEFAAKEKGETSVIASDIVDNIYKAIKSC